ncbi:MAG: hypothetical protein ACTSQJ_16935 [Promethearchaeota archaeon]
MSILEKDYYPIIKTFLQHRGYFPVKITPNLKVRDYYPDVTGLKRKKVITVEVKNELNTKILINAITQASIYQLGSTHSYIAFPLDSWRDPKKKKLRKLALERCKNLKLGIYLVDYKKGDVLKELKAKFNDNIDLEDYDQVIQQLEGTCPNVINNTLPEYIRDLCKYLSDSPSNLTRRELFNRLEREFSKEYWLKDAAHNTKPINRIKATLKGLIALNLIEIDPAKDEDTIHKNDIIKLTSYGKLLNNFNEGKINKAKPDNLDEKMSSYLSGYLLKNPIIMKTVEILTSEKRSLLLHISKCIYCDFKTTKFSELIEDNEFKCPSCNEELDLSLNHRLRVYFGTKEDYWDTITFTKNLEIFELNGKPLEVSLKIR